MPAAVQTLTGQLAAADRVVISTPEYNEGVPAGLKNVLDWVSCTKGNPWAGKPVATMSAAGGRAGGERAQVMLRSCLVAFRPHMILGPEIAVADSSKQFDSAGRLTKPLCAQSLAALMEQLQAALPDQRT